MMLKPEPMLMIPGPTPVPQDVLSALAMPPIGHRSGAFKKVLENVQPKLQWLFQTKRPVYIYAASGTGAMEAAICNVLQAGEEILVLTCGVFSTRWADIAQAFGVKVHTLAVADGQINTSEALTEFLQRSEAQNIKAVCLIHNETSTGVINPLPELCQTIKQHTDALILVDTVTSLGATNFEFDNWGIDVAVSGSQKGFMLPPGLAFLVASERAMARHKTIDTPGYYFNFSKNEKAILDGQTAYTPAVTLIQGLDVALTMMQEDGLNGIFSRHTLNKNMTRAALKALGLTLFVPNEDWASPSVTSVLPPAGVDVEAIRKPLRETFGITVAGGQKDMKGKIFRIGHLGAIFPRDILTTISALEVVLAQCGQVNKAGVGTAAAQAVLVQTLSAKEMCHA